MPKYTTPPPKKTALDNAKLSIKGKPWTEGDFKTMPSLQPRYVNGNIWLTCYSNNPNEDNDVGAINIKMDPLIANVVLEVIEMAIQDTDGFTTVGIENKGYTFYAGNKSDKPAVLNQIYIGVNPEKEICIIVKENKRPAVTFPFTTTFWYNLTNKAGDALGRGEVSKLVAKAWVKTVRQLMGPIVNENYTPPEPRNQQGSGGHSNQNSQGGSTNACNEIDDDIPF